MSDDIPLSEAFQPAPGVKYEDTVETPTEAPAEVKAPEPTEEVKTSKPETTETPAPAEDPQRYKKAKPIADLLSKKHELETALETERREKQELQAKLQAVSEQPKPMTDTDLKALAEEYQVDETFLQRVIETARKGNELPKEVQDLLQEREIQKQTEAESQAFNKRVDSLATALKDDSLKDPNVRQKLMELAYSTQTAPDGEAFHQKELAELYFGFIKPEIEPGKTSAESSRGGSKTTTVVDFEDIARRDDPKDFEAMDDETFTKFNKWMEERNGKTPLRRF